MPDDMMVKKEVQWWKWWQVSLLGNASRKGQITVFILVGLLLLFLFALMLLLVSSGRELKPADEAGINGFLQDCMRMQGRDSLKFIGTQGGAETLPLTRWFDKRMTPLPLKVIEDNLARDLQERMPLCLNEIRGNFKGIETIGRADPKAETAITQSTVVFKLNYPLPVALKDGTTFIVSDKTVTEPNKLMQIIGLTLATTMSETQYDGLIDLDALKTHEATMTFFPNNQELVAFARDDGYFLNPYEFAFANRR